MPVPLRGKKSIQKIAISDALWDIFQKMSDDMGLDRDALIQQAMVIFARQSGYMADSSAAAAGNEGYEAPPSPRRPVEMPPPPPLPPPPAPGRPAEAENARGKKLKEELERQARLERERRLREELEKEKRPPPPPPPAAVPERPAAAAKPAASLYIVTESGEMRKVDKDRFLIGRDKKCDFTIDSSKVSREHAAIVREKDGHCIEDLNSSNGTWFKQERITKHKIEDGNVYYVCNEKVKCVIR